MTTGNYDYFMARVVLRESIYVTVNGVWVAVDTEEIGDVVLGPVSVGVRMEESDALVRSLAATEELLQVEGFAVSEDYWDYDGTAAYAPVQVPLSCSSC